jgi:hypothetical protein
MEAHMFVRAAWRNPRLPEFRQNLRGMDHPSRRDGDPMGISGADFGKMTRGLFDR